MTMLSRPIVIVAWLMASSSCSLVVEADKVQCEQDADCEALGYEGATCGEDSLCVLANDPFSCRDVPFPDLSMSETVDFTLGVANLVDLSPNEGLVVQACSSLDTDCTAPADMDTTDANGAFSLTLAEGFRGFLFVDATAEQPDIAPLRAYLFPPPSNDPNVPLRAGLVVTTLQFMTGLAMAAQSTLEPGSGHVFFTAIDCQGQPLSGVTVSSSVQGQETLVAYLGAAGQPDLNLVGTGVSGQGAMINIPDGFVTIRGVHETEGLIFEQSVYIAPDGITSVPIVPSPTE